MSEHPADHVAGTTSGSGATDRDPVIASLSPLALQYLDQTRPWVRFMSVVTFVASGLMVLSSLVMLAVGIFGGAAASNSGGPGVLGSAIGIGVLAFVYLALACAYIAPGLYLSRYASAIKRLKADCTAGGLEDALKHQKSFWRFVGILTAIGFVVLVIVFGLGLVAGVIAGMMAARG